MRKTKTTLSTYNRGYLMQIIGNTGGDRRAATQTRKHDVPLQSSKWKIPGWRDKVKNIEVESLCCIQETNIILYVSYTLIG